MYRRPSPSLGGEQRLLALRRAVLVGQRVDEAIGEEEHPGAHFQSCHSEDEDEDEEDDEDDEEDDEDLLSAGAPVDDDEAVDEVD
jgi:hypothetical protein